MRAHLTAKSHRGCVGVNLKKLGTSNWWLLSPGGYDSSNIPEYSVDFSYDYINNNNIVNSYAFTLTINLKADIKFTGTGTSTDPYKIVTE